ncbi:MAG: XdhC family protein [Planctomycetota bacterium]|jgi:xanthine dehydrogenase accessory factor
MKVWRKLAERAANDLPSALATVISTEGSSPAQAAMKMLVGAEGRVAGTVGGGRVEAEIESAARSTLESGRHTILSFTLDDDLADEGGLICGGTIRVLVERIAPPASWAAEAVRAREAGQRAALLARIGDDVERSLVLDDDADPYLADETPRVEDSTFVEPLFRPRCILVGAGHVGRAVGNIATEAGFGLSVIDDRPEMARLIEAEHTFVGDLLEGLDAARPGKNDFIVVMTRGHGIDLRCVRAALQTPVRYVGMLASRRKVKAITTALDQDGIAWGERLHAPVGLDLGAVSAGEIAVSVVAQLIKVRRLGRGDR